MGKSAWKVLAVQTVTLSRVASSAIFVTIAHYGCQYSLLLAIYLYAALTDIADGYMARRLGCTSLGGHALDWLGDKYLNVASILFAYSNGIHPVPCLAVVLRDLALQAFRDTRIGNPDIYIPRRLNGILTGLPIRVGVVLLLASRITDVDSNYWIYCFGFAGSISGLSLILMTMQDWSEIKKTFDYDLF